MDVFEKENGKFEKIKEKSFSDNGGVNDIQDHHSDEGELRLENLIIDHPELIPADRFKADKWIPIAKQISLEGHYPDTIGVDDTGNLYIIENKLDKNPDKKTVRSQIRDYALGIRKLRVKSKGWQEFLDIIKNANESSAEDVKRRESIHDKSLEEILHDKLDDGSSTQKSQDCLQEIKKNFEDGEIILIIAIDKIRRNLRTSIDGENELDGEKLPMFALEVNEFKTKKDETIVISSTYPFDLDDLIDKKEGRRTTNNQKSFDDIYSKTILSEEQKNNFEDFKNRLRNICIKFNYNTGKDPAIMPRFEDIAQRSVVRLFAMGDLEIDITTIHDWEEKQKKYKDEIEKNVSFKKLMDGRPGKILRFKAQEWMPFSDHILSVLKKVFTEE